MKILNIQKNKLYLSNEEIMDISPLIRQKYNLKKNDNIEGLYDEISYEASLEKGIYLVSLKDRTEKELFLKLNEKYKNKKMIKKAIERLKELGYINDLSYAMNFIRSKKYGKQRVSFLLYQKGIVKNIVEDAYFELEENENFEKIENEKLEKAILKNIKKDKQKLVQYLVRQGFSLDKILKKLKEM